MRRSLRLLLSLAVVAVVAVVPSLARAQQALPESGPAPIAPTTRADSSVAAMRSMTIVLRQLAGAEERYYGEHGTYTTDVAALGLLDMAGLRSGRAPWVAVAFAGGRSWSAESRHAMLKGKSCVMYVGPAALIPGGAPTTLGARLPAEPSGAPTCDAL
jgi:hypothetical protein